MKLRKVFLLVAIMLAVMLCLYRLAHYLNMARFPVHGLDVSHYQSQIDWEGVADQYAFVFVKALEGTTLQDISFSQHWQQLKGLPIRRGAYHYFLPATPATEQAKAFIKLVALRRGDLPPVIDVEVTQGVAPKVLVRGVRQWLQIVESHYQVKPVIYTSQAFYQQYLKGKLDEYPIWVARYSFFSPDLNTKWHFWQYSDRGKVKGITGRVDLNVFSGSLSDLEQMCLH